MKRIVTVVTVIACLSGANGALAQETYDPEARLAEAGIVLPEAPNPVANYVEAVRAGDLLFLAGHGECGGPDSWTRGKVGRDLTIEEGYASARETGLCILATLKSELGDLSRVRRVVKVVGMVNATDDFQQHPSVVNGFSDLMVEVFGERGKHARAAVGMGSLPFDIAIEIDVVVEIEPES